MRFSGLKASIAGTLVMLLSVALVLGNIVTVVFWQKSLVRSEIANAQAMIGIIEEFFEEKINSGSPVSVKDLNRIVSKSERSDFSLLYYDGNKPILNPGASEDKGFEQIVRNSGLIQQEVVTMKGTRWAILSFGSKSLILARPVLAGTQKNAALGIKLELESVYGRGTG